MKMYLVILQYSAFIEANSEEAAKHKIVTGFKNGEITYRNFEVTAEEETQPYIGNGGTGNE